jgi:hypothetical protein
MGNDKSILEKFTDTVKDIASIAAEAANHALSAEEPVLKPGERAVAYMPLAADGFVGDPMMVAPIVGARKKKRAAAKPAANKARKKTAAKASKKTAGKTATRKKSKKAAKKAAKKVKTNTKKAKGNTGKKT